MKDFRKLGRGVVSRFQGAKLYAVVGLTSALIGAVGVGCVIKEEEAASGSDPVAGYVGWDAGYATDAYGSSSPRGGCRPDRDGACVNPGGGGVEDANSIAVNEDAADDAPTSTGPSGGSGTGAGTGPGSGVGTGLGEGSSSGSGSGSSSAGSGSGSSSGSGSGGSTTGTGTGSGSGSDGSGSGTGTGMGSGSGSGGSCP